MRCSSTREELLESIILAEKATGKNHTLPILSCVILTVQENILTVTATNLEVGVRYTIPITHGTDGSVAVSGLVLAQVITTLQTGSTVTLETKGGYLLIQSVTGESKITLQDTNEFPLLPIVESGTTCTLPAHALYSVITSVAYCASTSIIKPELSSVYIHPDGGVLIAAATDSFRLAEKRIPLPQPVSIEPFLIPVRSTHDLLKLLEHTNNDITVSVSEHQLSIQTQNAYLTLRLVSGTFPDYTQIIPKKFITEATVVRYDFEHILRRAGVFVDQFNQTTLSLFPKKKECSIYTQHTTIGEVKDSIHTAVTGQDITISFNQRYLLDSLTSIATDSITLQFAGQAQPAVIRPVGDTTFLYLVMPMNR